MKRMSSKDQAAIIESFQRLAIKPGGVLFFTPQDALLVVEALEQAQVRILGFDAVRITENKTQPFMEHSLDLSKFVGNTWKESKRFLNEKRNSELLFEVVADG